MGTSLPYAAIHQTGGIVQPRSGKFLAIPLTGPAQRAKSPRRFAGSLGFRPSKSRLGGVLVDKKGTAQYALVKSVAIPARPFLGLSQSAAAQIERIVIDALAGRVGV